MKMLVILTAFFLAGCEVIAPNAVANVKLAKSQEALRACVMAHQTEAAKECDAQKMLYEMDLRTAQATVGQ